MFCVINLEKVNILFEFKRKKKNVSTIFYCFEMHLYEKTDRFA